MNTNYRILVVDDEEDLCDILKFNLENEGYEVETANSAEEALKMDLTKFHLLLLDGERCRHRIHFGGGRLYFQALFPARSADENQGCASSYGAATGGTGCLYRF